MSEKLKPRNTGLKNNQDQKWRNKAKQNTSSMKYNRECILLKYSESNSFPIDVPEDILPLFEPKSLLPLLTLNGFSHGLGEDVNSRKFAPKEKKNEKHSNWLDKAEEIKKEECQLEEEHKENLNTNEIIDENKTKINDAKYLQTENIHKNKGNNKEIIELDSNLVNENDRVEEKKKKTTENDKNKSKKNKKINKKEATQGGDNEKNVVNPIEKHEKNTKSLQETKKPQQSNKKETTISEETKDIADIKEEKSPKEPQKMIIPAYDKSLLMAFVNNENPFAKAMIQSGIESSEKKIYFPASSKAYERV